MSFLLAGLRGYDVQAHLFQRRQPATSYPEQTRSPLQQQNPNFMTVVALSVGLKLTSLCSRLASTVCDQLTKDAAWVRQAACSFRQQSGWLSRRPLHQVKDDKHDQQHQRQQQAEQQVSKKEQLAAQLLQAQSMLQTHRPDKELIRVIKSLGDSNIPLDTKWLEFTQRLASHGHDAISDSMKQLFIAAGESSEAVQALLSPEQQSQELWKSQRTQSVIQQEQAFKQMVFHQLLLTN